MKVFRVNISSYETDNSCATYDYSEDYSTFEEAQEALEEIFWKFEESYSLTKRHSKYNWHTHGIEEDSNSKYYYTFEITSNSFDIDGDWSNYSGEIIEKEISISLPTGHWHYINKDGLPKKKGMYLISYTTPKGDVTVYSYFNPDMRNVDDIHDYSEGFFESSYMEHEYWRVYAWTETIQPASK